MRIGDYVLATKYTDGDPCDHWAVGFYAGKSAAHTDRHFVTDNDGKQMRRSGFRRCEPITKEMGEWLLRVVPPMQTNCPPGVNIWKMIDDCRHWGGVG